MAELLVQILHQMAYTIILTKTKGAKKMSKGLRNMTEKERKEAIKRRINSRTGGIGYWAAVDAIKEKEKEKEKENNEQ